MLILLYSTQFKWEEERAMVEARKLRRAGKNSDSMPVLSKSQSDGLTSKMIKSSAKKMSRAKLDSGFVSSISKSSIPTKRKGGKSTKRSGLQMGSTSNE